MQAIEEMDTFPFLFFIIFFSEILKSRNQEPVEATVDDFHLEATSLG